VVVVVAWAVAAAVFLTVAVVVVTITVNCIVFLFCKMTIIDTTIATITHFAFVYPNYLLKLLLLRLTGVVGQGWASLAFSKGNVLPTICISFGGPLTDIVCSINLLNFTKIHVQRRLRLSYASLLSRYYNNFIVLLYIHCSTTATKFYGDMANCARCLYW